MCWGVMHGHLLGAAPILNSPTPVLAQGLSGATQVAAGNSDSCVVLAAGVVACWGQNTHGQLGTGTTKDSPVPVRVLGLEAVKQISLGFDYACAVLSNGALACWGRARDLLSGVPILGIGDFGEEGEPDRLVPMAVIGSVAAPVSSSRRSRVRFAAGRVTLSNVRVALEGSGPCPHRVKVTVLAGRYGTISRKLLTTPDAEGCLINGTINARARLRKLKTITLTLEGAGTITRTLAVKQRRR